jgi:hypothetical protein
MLGTLRAELRRLTRLAAGRTPGPTLAKVRADPARTLSLAGMSPDPWQAALLRSTNRRLLVLNARQTGKSTAAAALALKTALLTPGALVLLLSPTQRQSGELFRKAAGLYRALGKPVAAVRQTALSLELMNGSRIVALPGDEEGIRCFSAPALVILDEASRTADALYRSVRPMLAVSRGVLAAFTTPFGMRGWFWEAWERPGPWRRVRVTADQCARITPAFLEEERQALGERWYRQEYECSFEAAVEAYFDHAAVMAALAGGVQPVAEGIFGRA